MNNNLFNNVSHWKWLAFILLALIFAATYLLFRPGIVMSDTLARWAAVFTIAGKLNIGWATEQWLAPTMTIFMLPIGFLGLPTECFTAFQFGYTLLASSMWIVMTSSQKPFWISVTFFLPLISIYLPFVVPDVWTLGAILVIVGSVYAIEHGWRWMPIALFFMSCIVLFGFRQNALILLPVICVMVFTGKMITPHLKGLLLSLIVISITLISVTPSWLGFGERTSSAAAPAWELIGMLRIAKESQIPVDSTLTLEGIANTNHAIEKHSFSTIDTLLWEENAALPTFTILDNSTELKSRWLRMIFNHPSLYFFMKMRTYKCMFGLCDQYLQTQIEVIEPWPELNGLVSAYNKPKGISRIMFEFGNWTGHALKAAMIPIFWLPISLVVFLLNWKLYGHYDRWLIAMTSAYMASFFILNQAASFRYMFPVYVVFTAYQFRFFGVLAGIAWWHLKWFYKPARS